MLEGEEIIKDRKALRRREEMAAKTPEEEGKKRKG